MLSKLALVYRGSRDGQNSKDFHSNCDGISKTLTLIKTSNGNIFGGYTAQAWSSNDENVADPNAFIFSLVNKDKRPFKAMCLNGGKNAIGCYEDCGPIFGVDVDSEEESNGNSNREADYEDGESESEHESESESEHESESESDTFSESDSEDDSEESVGSYDDICISSNFESYRNVSHFGNRYKHPDYKTNSILAGACRFHVSEIEVYTVINF